MKYVVCTLEQLQTNNPFITTVNHIEIGIFRDHENVYAVRNMCPHKLAPVCKGRLDGTMLPSEPCEYRFGLQGQVLKCPWHGWEFSLVTGEAMFGISQRKVKTYPVTIEKDQVVVEM